MHLTSNLSNVVTKSNNTGWILVHDFANIFELKKLINFAQLYTTG